MDVDYIPITLFLNKIMVFKAEPNVKALCIQPIKTTSKFHIAFTTQLLISPSVKRKIEPVAKAQRRLVKINR